MTDEITLAIEAIPPDTPRTDLPDRLEPIMGEIAKLGPARREAYLHVMKQRFDLDRFEVEAYRKQLNCAARRRERETEEEAPAQEVTPTAALPNLVDLVDVDGKPAFLILDSGRLVIEESVERDEIRYVPPAREHIPWLLPRADKVLRWVDTDSDAQLFDDLVAHHRAISELPSDGYYELIAAWDFHTYHLEPVQYSPIFSLFGVPERGKSRTGKGMIYVAYRGLRVESLRDPYIIRVANDLQVTLFFDVMDLWEKAVRGTCEDILLNRFERGATVPRVMHPDLGPHRDITYYSIFGPTIVGSNEAVHKILDTRAISITLQQSQRRFDDDITPERGLPYRERLVAFRARHLGKGLEEIEKPAFGRLGDIMRPLVQIIRLVRPDRELAMRELILEIEQSRRNRKSETLEGELLEAIWGLRGEVLGGLLPVKRITDLMNEGKPDREKVTYQKVGRRLDALGIKKGEKTGKKTATIRWNEKQLVELLSSYGLRETPETPETPSSLLDRDLRGGISEGVLGGDDQDADGKCRVATPCNETISGVSGVSGVSSHELDTADPTPALEDADWDAFFEYAGKLMDSGVPQVEADARAWEVVTLNRMGRSGADGQDGADRNVRTGAETVSGS